jgi:hypothetical protein
MDFSLYAFDNGVQILQLRSLNVEQVSDEIVQLVESLESIDASQLAKTSGVSLVLAAERSGK